MASSASSGGNSVFTTSWGRILLPALIFQSVAIGGAYATGREIVEFGAKYGALGWAAGFAMMVAGTVVAFLVYEVARRYGAYDYRSLLQRLIGPAYWLFDAIYLPLSIAILAVLASATGNILESTLNLDYWVGVGVVVAVSAVTTFYGTGIIEKFNSLGTVLLTVAYIAFAALVIPPNWHRIVDVFRTGDHSLFPEATLADAAVMGLTYAGMGFVIYPSTLFTVRRLRRSRDSAVSALLTGVLFVVPWFLTYLALLGFYPDPAVFDAPVPWLQMLNGHGAWIVVIFGVLVGWTLVSTGVGLIQAALARISQNLVDRGKPELTPRTRGMVAVVSLVVAAALSRIGIIDLIATGYLIGAVALIAVFGIPLLVRGPYLILTAKTAARTRQPARPNPMPVPIEPDTKELNDERT